MSWPVGLSKVRLPVSDELKWQGEISQEPPLCYWKLYLVVEDDCILSPETADRYGQLNSSGSLNSVRSDENHCLAVWWGQLMYWWTFSSHEVHGQWSLAYLLECFSDVARCAWVSGGMSCEVVDENLLKPNYPVCMTGNITDVSLLLFIYFWCLIKRVPYSFADASLNLSTQSSCRGVNSLLPYINRDCGCDFDKAWTPRIHTRLTSIKRAVGAQSLIYSPLLLLRWIRRQIDRCLIFLCSLKFTSSAINLMP